MEKALKEYERTVPELKRKLQFTENARDTLSHQFESAWAAKEQAETDLLEQMEITRTLKAEAAARWDEVRVYEYIYIYIYICIFIYNLILILIPSILYDKSI